MQENDFVDLSHFDELQKIQDEGREFPILDAAGSLTDIRLRVAGPDSEVQRRAKHAADAFLNDIRERGAQPTDDDLETYSIMRMTAAVIGLSGLEGYDGKPMEGTAENVEMLLRRFPAFRDQVAVLASSRVLYSPEKDDEPAQPKQAAKAKPAGKRKG